LFATRGIEAVPLRDIGVAADQKNNVAVQYHFGDKESLLKEITSYRARVTEEARAELLADLLAAGRPPQVIDLVPVWVHALARHLEEDNYYLAFLSRYVIERGGHAGLEGMGVATAVHTSATMLRRLLPVHPEILLKERWQVMMASTVHELARYQTALRSGGTLPAPLPDLIDDLVTFMAAGLEAAPAGAPRARRLPARVTERPRARAPSPG
jgi:AcrR family transcriptional regulator